MKPAEDGFFHPAGEEELAALVRLARREGRQLRVIGSGRSVPAAFRCDAGAGLAVRLDRLAAIRFDDEQMRVTVGGGCHLGFDPRNPAASGERSLLAALVARGWALPDLGGVAHQTVSGFLSTGSSGGTAQHALEDAVVSMRLVDGTGAIHTWTRGRDAPFHAATCALGLLGVITEITLQCQPHYDVRGREDTASEADTPYALYGDGEAGLEGFLRRTEYARLMWFPQDRVRRVITWAAHRMGPTDYDVRTGSPGALRPRPYRAVGDAGRWPVVGPLLNQGAQAALGTLYASLAASERGWAPLAGRSRRLRATGGRLQESFGRRVLPRVLGPFVAANRQEFWGSWHRTLPMDEQMSERWLPTTFTELWLPLERAGEVLRALRQRFDCGGHAATGSYLIEVYASRATEGWLHPSTGRDSLRLDLFWYARNPSDPARGWFVPFWEALRPFGYRLHWGKILPQHPELGARYLARQFPRWGEFLALRERLDPSGVFLTRYWARALGLGT